MHKLLEVRIGSATAGPISLRYVMDKERVDTIPFDAEETIFTQVAADGSLVSVQILDVLPDTRAKLVNLAQQYDLELAPSLIVGAA